MKAKYELKTISFKVHHIECEKIHVEFNKDDVNFKFTTFNGPLRASCELSLHEIEPMIEILKTLKLTLELLKEESKQ